MSSDILQKVREEILKEDEKYLPWVPANLDDTWERQAGIAAAIAGAIAGFYFGSSLGIVGGFGGIAGTIPCTIIGGIVGYFTGAKIGSKYQKQANEFDFSSHQSRIASGNASVLLGGDKKCPHCGAILKGNERCPNCTLVLSSADRCFNCGELKSKYWDSKNRRCGKCHAGASVLAYLKSSNGDRIISTITTTIGRGAFNSIVISDDSFVSGSHAKIVLSSGVYRITDLGSTNGTRINGEKINQYTATDLENGDKVHFGQTGFTFEC